VSDLALTDAGRLPSAALPERERLHQVARGLEGTFLQQLFQAAEQHNDDDEEPFLGGSNESRQFQSLLHGALSEQSAGSLGIAAVVEKALSERLHRQATAAKSEKEQMQERKIEEIGR
jgi:Rod binding domain-containing protein